MAPVPRVETRGSHMKPASQAQPAQAGFVVIARRLEPRACRQRAIPDVLVNVHKAQEDGTVSFPSSRRRFVIDHRHLPFPGAPQRIIQYQTSHKIANVDAAGFAGIKDRASCR
jgi:hypothetical protein